MRSLTKNQPRKNRGQSETGMLDALRKSRAVASRSMKSMKGFCLEFQRAVEELIDKTEAISLPDPSRYAHLADFIRNQEGYRARMLSLQNHIREDFVDSIQNLEQFHLTMNIVLIGKSQVGKSTTMSALLGLDDREIGKGRQNTTKVAREWFYPKNSKLLRIVDTPGIEAYKGEEFIEITRRSLDIADHIFFLLDTDKMMNPGEREWYRHISLMGKPISVLLNYKSKEKYLKKGSDHIYRKKGEYESVIREAIEEIFGVREDFQIVHYHAAAAWMSQQPAAPFGFTSTELEEISNLVALRTLIREVSVKESLNAKIKAPQMLLSAYYVDTTAEIVPWVKSFRVLEKQISEFQTTMHKTLPAIERFGLAQFNRIKERFNGLTNAFDELVDDVVANGRDGAWLDKEFSKILLSANIKQWGKEASAAIEDYTRGQIEMDLDAFTRGISFDEKKMAISSKINLEEVHSHHKSADLRRLGRASIKTAGGVGGAALATWAVTNFWNPTGWAAALALGGVAILGGIVGSKTTGLAADAWREEDAASVRRHRQRILRDIKNHVANTIQPSCEQALDKWLGKYLEYMQKTIDGATAPFSAFCRQTRETSAKTLAAIGSLLCRMDAAQFRVWAKETGAVVPFNLTNVERVANHPHANNCKILAKLKPPFRQGTYDSEFFSELCDVATFLNSRWITFVDTTSSLEEQAKTALGLFRNERVECDLGQQNSCAVFYVAEKNLKFALGPNGLNVQLTKRLLNFSHVIVKKLNTPNETNN